MCDYLTRRQSRLMPNNTAPDNRIVDLLKQALKAGETMSKRVSEAECSCTDDRQCDGCESYETWRVVSDEIEDTLLDMEYTENDDESDDREAVWEAIEDLRIKTEAVKARETESQEAAKRVEKLETIRANLLRAVEKLGECNIEMQKQRDGWYKIAEMYYLCADGADGAFQRALGERD